MEVKALVIEVQDRKARVIAQVSSKYMADAMATGLQRMQHRGEMSDAKGYTYCEADRLHQFLSCFGYCLEDSTNC